MISNIPVNNNLKKILKVSSVPTCMILCSISSSMENADKAFHQHQNFQGLRRNKQTKNNNLQILLLKSFTD